MMFIRQALRRLRRLRRDEDGAVLIYTTVILTVVVGIGVLSVDVGRATTMHSQLQHAADAAALAGARELDLLPDSHDRARAAVAQALTNTKDFSTDAAAAVTISTRTCGGAADSDCIRFLSGLPADDADPVTATFESTNPAQTSFIEVRVAPSGFTAMFAAVVTAEPTMSLGARAIAGNDSLICEVPPMFMCNPDEPAPIDIDAMEGRQLRIFMQGASGQLGPGNFGLLCPAGVDDATNCGGRDVGDNLASTTGTCMRRRNMTTKTGVTLQMVRTGINARFDWWLPQARNDAGAWRFQDVFAPARNVTMGRGVQGNPTGGNVRCDRPELDDTTALKLPRDSCHIDNNCAVPLGDGDWDHAEYFEINHGGDGSAGFRPVGWPPGLPVTRFNVYRFEIEHNRIVSPGQAISGGGTTTEDGTPQCFQGTMPATDYTYLDTLERNLELLRDRRILPVALSNCEADEISGRTEFRPDDFVFLFMTEPMGSPSDSALYVEVLGRLDGEAQQALLRDVVQIYRR